MVVLLNLSRDQLDRFGEVRTVAAQWRRALSVNPATVVANADDPLVVWGTGAAEDVTFVGVGLGWHLDAISCPACGERIESTDGDWWCSGCTLRRPAGYQLDGDELRDLEGAVVAVLRPGVPGRHNLANAALAVVAATKLGVDPEVAARATESVTSVAGRYQTVSIGRSQVRLLLAKNPAGWHELLTMIDGETRPVLLAINARIADGRDPSWLWDVDVRATQRTEGDRGGRASRRSGRAPPLRRGRLRGVERRRARSAAARSTNLKSTSSPTTRCSQISSATFGRSA